MPNLSPMWADPSTLGPLCDQQKATGQGTLVLFLGPEGAPLKAVSDPRGRPGGGPPILGPCRLSPGQGSLEGTKANYNFWRLFTTFLVPATNQES